jgi:hypothetical protein
MNRRAIRSLVVVAAAGLSVAAWISGHPQDGLTLRPAVTDAVQPGSGVVVVERSHPKMEHALTRLAETWKVQGAEAGRAFALQREIDVEDGSVRVIAEAAPVAGGTSVLPSARVVAAKIASLGGTVLSSFRGLVEARVPVAALENLADHPLVSYLRRPLRPRRMTVSEGVERIGADLWTDLSPFHTGSRETKVCVLDLGFMGYESLKGSELSSDVSVRSFRADRDLAAGEDHGAACAEIVYDVAPGAKMWLANFATEGEYHDAVNWILSQRFDVVSYSIGWINAGDGKGTGPISEDVQRATANGTVWVAAAGNNALAHFIGDFNDPDEDGWMEFPNGSEFLSWTVPALTATSAYLNWDDWGSWNSRTYEYSGSTQDYDLYFYVLDNGAWRLVDQSVGAQTGVQWPTEDLSEQTSAQTTSWAVRIRKKSATRNCRMELFVDGNSGAIANNVPQGSLLIPADADGAISVGAVHWSNDQREPYHVYSSQGPTKDGRVKPEFSAPSGVTTKSWGTRNFYGTSAATPHVAGAVALLRQKTNLSLPEILEVLAARAVDLGDPGKDSIYGFGRVNVKK